jgi:hypothetical protein
MQNPNHLNGPQKTTGGLIAKIIATISGVAVLIVGVLFSAVLLAIAAVVGCALVGYFWWKTRALRKTLRQAAQDPAFQQAARRPFDPAPGGRVIEGEAVREPDESPPTSRITK